MAKKKKIILFSCLGTTDPVREMHDGSMLHIVRHYRPDKIFWYMTKEIHDFEKKDNRFVKSIEWLKKIYPDYDPEILPPCYDDLIDASDFDVFYEPFVKELNRLIKLNPEAEILVNLSSGTPQMKMTLALLVSDTRFNLKPIQVKNFQKKSGSADRTNKKDYDVDAELELNEDDKEEAENRCVEPKLFLAERSRRYNQIAALVKHYDYEALKLSLDILPEKIKTLVQHLACRANYMSKDAQNLAKQCNRLESLYPIGERDCSDEMYEYSNLSEYVLMLDIMRKTGRLTDMVIRLNPLILRLQKVWLKKILPEKQKIELDDIFVSSKANLDKIKSRAELSKIDGLMEWLDYNYKGNYNDTQFINLSFLNTLAEWAGESESNSGRFFKAMEKLNAKERNIAAHRLANVDEDHLKEFIKGGSAEIIENLVSLLKELFPKYYRSDLFDIFDRANKWILEAL